MIAYNRKKNALIAVDALLLLLIVLGFVFSPRSSGNRASRKDILRDVATVASFTIDGIESVKVVKSGTVWTVADGDGNLPADGARIDAFLKAVDQVERLERVATGKASWGSLGLDGDSARTVRMFDAKGIPLCDFILGEYAQAANSVYIAISGGDEAYSADSGMASYILGKRNSWLDLKAWTTTVGVEEVQQVSIKGYSPDASGALQAISYTATRSGADWTADGQKLDKAKTEALIRAILSLRGEDYAAESETAGPVMSILRLELSNGRFMNLSIEEKGENGKYPAASSHRNRRLYLPAWVLTEALKPLDALMPAASGS
jgi:hypothetical protein